MRTIGNPQTFLTHSGVDRLVDDCLAGFSVGLLTQKYGVHRATVSKRLNRHDVVRRQSGLTADEAAEAVKLHGVAAQLRRQGKWWVDALRERSWVVRPTGGQYVVVQVGDDRERAVGCCDRLKVGCKVLCREDSFCEGFIVLPSARVGVAAERQRCAVR